MDSGFSKRHFELLRTWGGKLWTDSDEQKDVRTELGEAYRATKAWAEALAPRISPNAQTEGRMAVISQGKHFSPYIWWRIYPSERAPRSLAYTVGIDRSGEFIVKIDTYRPAAAQRKAYQELGGRTYADAPFAAVLTEAKGLSLSFEELVDWAAEALASFAPNYEEIVRRIGLERSPTLRLLDDKEKTREQLKRWRDALLDGAIAKRGKLWWVPEGRFVLSASKGDGPLKHELGTDPSGKGWLVQINEPGRPGDRNPLTAIAVDGGGRPYLLRQGVLIGNHLSERIDSEEFALRTGHEPVTIDGSKEQRSRSWFLVAALDEEPALIRAMTDQFVRACQVARQSDTALIHPAPLATYRLAADEKGGTYIISGREATEPQEVVRRQGIVWLALKERFGKHGLELEKPVHPLGYEVDGTIRFHDGRNLLIEIKTSVSAAEIHAGIGQLHFYRALMPTLANHAPVLLLPKRPIPSEVIDAIASLGIAIHYYNQASGNDDTRVEFGEEFWAYCCLPLPS